LQKGVTIEQTVRTLDAARRVGLPVFAYVMLGFPGQTRAEMLEEIASLKANRVEYASFSVLTIYPKTPLYHRSLADGSLKQDPWPAFAQDPEIVIEPPAVNGVHSRSELQEIQLEVSRRFYFSPRSLWHRVREVRSWSDLRRRAGIGLRLLRG